MRVSFNRGLSDVTLGTANMNQKDYRHLVGETKALWTFPCVAISLSKQTFSWSVFTRFHTSFLCSSLQLTSPPKNVVLHARANRAIQAIQTQRLYERAGICVCRES
jgi:hypothetical protein